MSKKILGFILIIVNIFVGGFFTIQDVRAEGLAKAEAYEAIVKIRSYTEDIDFFLEDNSSGSGVIIDESGIVLTNNHVISNKDDNTKEKIPTGLVVCITETVEKKPVCEYTADIIATDEEKDLALIKIRNIEGLSSKSTFPYLDIANESPEMSEVVSALGFPQFGGENITITQGVVSGREEDGDLNWIKSDAMTSFGSSGGALVNEDGKLLGINSKAKTDSLFTTMGMALDVSKTIIKNWIAENKTKTPTTNPLEQKTADLTKRVRRAEKTNVFTDEYIGYQFIKPTSFDILATEKNINVIPKNYSEDSPSFMFGVYKLPYEARAEHLQSIIKKNLFPTIEIEIKEEVSIGQQNIKAEKAYFRLKGLFENDGDIYIIEKDNYLFLLEYEYGENDEYKNEIDGIIDSITMTAGEYHQSASNKTEYQSSGNYGPTIEIKVDGSKWLIEEKNSQEGVVIHHKSNHETSVSVSIHNNTQNEKLEDIKEDIEKEIIDTNRNSDFWEMEVVNKRSNIINEGVFGLKQKSYLVENEIVDPETKKLYVKIIKVFIPNPKGTVVVETMQTHEDNTDFKKNIQDFFQDTELSIEGIGSTGRINPINITTTGDDEGEDNNEDENEDTPTHDIGMAKRLKGRILLAVQDKGRIFYVNPESNNKEEITFANAMEIFETMALGISNTDLNKIAIHPDSFEDEEQDTDGDGFSDKKEAEFGYNPEIASNPEARGNDKMAIDKKTGERLKGKLLMQVEDRGRIWYIDSEGKRWEITFQNLMNTFRKLALGVSDVDLNKIPGDR